MALESDLFGKFGRHVEAGKIIFQEGDEGDQMYIIQSGKVKISRHISGKEHVLAILEKGDFFGEMAIVNKVQRSATVTAIDAVDLLAFNREGFLSMINKNAKIALHIIDKLCRRLQNANIHIKHLARKNARGLVALNLLYTFQGVGEEQPQLAYDRTVEEFSRNLELSMDLVKEYLEGFQRLGIIGLEGNRVKLLDQQKLNSLAEAFGG
jgi:CRP/FNR family cyclic AMP-dependent transcriptional regulator